MSDIGSPGSFMSTSTPIGKQQKPPAPKLSMIGVHGDSKKNILCDSTKSDSFNNSDDRSRSNIENQSSNEDSLPFKGRSNQSLRERLMRLEHKKSKIPVSSRKPNYNRIDSSTDNSKSSDALMETVKSFASLNFSDKVGANRSGVIYESPPVFNSHSKSGRKLQRILVDSTNSSATYSSFNNKEEDDEHVSIVPESPLGSPKKSDVSTDKSSYESSFVVDKSVSKESSDTSFVSANDSSPKKVEEKNEDPSIITLSPIVKPKPMLPVPNTKSTFNRLPAPLVQQKIWPMFQSALPKFPVFNTQTQAPPRGPQIISPHTMYNKAHENALNNDPNRRLFGGKMNDQRIFNINQLTKAALSEIHTSLATLPDETVRADTPDGLRVSLMPHQQHGLAWMMWRECQSPPSGILADDMGLGKTLAVISLILQKKNNRLNKVTTDQEQEIRSRYAQGNRYIPSHSSLIIAPASVLLQWEKEIKDRVGGRLSYHIAHGTTRERFAKNLALYDIVLTTYGTITSELNPETITDSAFANIAWERVILDEAHKIKNRKSKVSRIAANLPGLYRWCLTGTPIHNELWDLYSLIRFMKISPFHEEAHWKQYIMTGNRNSERLNTLVKGILLRRTKAQIDSVTNKRIIDLPPRNYTVVNLELKGVEHKCYQQMFMASRQKVQQFIQNMDGGMMRNKKPGVVKNPFIFGQREISAGERFQAMNFILVLLLRLRQACVHMCLTRQAIDIDAFKQDADGDNLEKSVIDELERTFNSLNMTGEDSSAEHNRKVEELFEYSHKTAKIQAILSHLDQVASKGEKSVVVSQWTSVLSLLEPHLNQRRIKHTTINGQIPPKERQNRIDDFNRKNGGAEVMLLSLNAGGVGLNLTGGNHLFIVDLHWNPAIENQACDRIYRVGQTKEVFIHKFVVEQTIEQRVMALQAKKTQLADSVLQGATDKSLTKLTVNDLRFLFELDNRETKNKS